MTHPRWGATPEAWGILADSGLESDLLPVISNPNAAIAALSKLHSLGKVPSRYNREGHAVGIPAWTNLRATPRQVAGWAAHPDHGICVQTRRLRAIDIDIDDPTAAANAQAIVEGVLGPLPCRSRAGSGKRLLAVVCEGQLTKRIIRTRHGVVEWLADGQQFVAAGTHPSGVRYAWSGPGLDPLDEVPYTWPTCTLAQYDAAYAALAKLAVDPAADASVSRRGVHPAVPRVAAAGWGDPMPAWLADNGWVRSIERDGRIHVRCPFEDQHTTDTGPTATTYFPAGVGGFEQGHFRCLHAHCSGRTDQDFLDGMGLGVVHDFEPAPPAPVVRATPAGGHLAAFDDQGPYPPLTRKKDGTIVPTTTNLWALLQRPDIVRAKLAYDAFRDVVVIAYESDDKWRPLTDHDYFDLRRLLERVGVDAAPKDLVRDAALRVASDHVFDSAIEWGKTLVWDGVRRVDNFFLTYMSVPATEYTMAVARYLWTALAGRLMTPGCKVDMVPVLISPQGTGKTTMVESLAPIPETFVEINLKRKEDDLSRAMRGKLVGELAELRGVSSRDAEETKAWVTRRVEEWIPKFVEFGTRYPRRCVIIGTGNREFLDDETGERRWLPLRVGRTNTAELQRDLTQLWAEGVELYKAHGVQWRQAQVLATYEHDAFKVDDPWHPLVEQWLATDAMDAIPDGGGRTRGDGEVRVVDLLLGACGMSAAHINVGHERRIGKILARLGYVKTNSRVDGRVVKVWVKGV